MLGLKEVHFNFIFFLTGEGNNTERSPICMFHQFRNKQSPSPVVVSVDHLNHKGKLNLIT
jgi:hypothetical protein